MCKTNEGRIVPLNRELAAMFKAMPRGLPGVRIFTYKGRGPGAIKTVFKLYNTVSKEELKALVAEKI
jgi:hypothetical protein